jgi:hypothetical protein
VQTYIARRGLYRPILKNPGEEDTP